jgi:hypothetical protein
MARSRTDQLFEWLRESVKGPSSGAANTEDKLFEATNENEQQAYNDVNEFKSIYHACHV